MTEENRRKIIEIIQKGLKDKETLQSKYKELHNLTKDPNVAKYITLIEEIKNIEYDIEKYEGKTSISDDVLENRITNTFKKYVQTSTCEHEIMIYHGTQAIFRYPCNSYSKIYDAPKSKCSEPDIVRLYNCYKCLECGADAHIKMENVNEYEISHTVLKRYDDENLVKHYQDLYYNLLYNGCTSLEAQNQICEQFKKDDEKILIKKKNV